MKRNGKILETRRKSLFLSIAAITALYCIPGISQAAAADVVDERMPQLS